MNDEMFRPASTRGARFFAARGRPRSRRPLMQRRCRRSAPSTVFLGTGSAFRCRTRTLREPKALPEGASRAFADSSNSMLDRAPESEISATGSTGIEGSSRLARSLQLVTSLA